MSREIKFRAWDNRLNKYIDMFLGFTINDGVLEYLEDVFNVKKQVIIEQYTGLKDKNGVKIYEGDYIKAKSTIYEIEWFNTAFWAIPDIGYGSSQPISSLYEYEDGIAYKIEVIGNIHENQELLDEK